MSQHRTIVHLVISTLNRKSAKPLPLENRWHVLELESLERSIGTEILSIVDPPSARKQIAPPGAGEGQLVTMMVGPSLIDYQRLLGFRRLFRHCPPEELATIMQPRHDEMFAMKGPGVIPDYFEDDEGTPITMQQVFEHVHGSKGVLVLDDVASVLSIGATPPKNGDDWSQTTADLISHFLYITKRIACSEWYRSELSITFASLATGVSEFKGYTSPGQDETLQVLTLFRQLYSSDGVFNRAVNAYRRHLSHQGKDIWVEIVKKRFNRNVEAVDRFLPAGGLNYRELIDSFMYGAKLFHEKGITQHETTWLKLLSDIGANRAMMAVHGAMRMLSGDAILASYPIRQDFDRWITLDGLLAPKPIQPDDLFPKPPTLPQ